LISSECAQKNEKSTGLTDTYEYFGTVMKAPNRERYGLYKRFGESLIDRNHANRMHENYLMVKYFIL